MNLKSVKRSKNANSVNNYLPILFDCINENISPGVFTISACMCSSACVANVRTKKDMEGVREGEDENEEG